MVSGGRLVGRGSVVDGGRVVVATDRLVGIGGHRGDVAGLVLLLIVVLLDLIGLGRGLAVHRSGMGTVGLSDGGGHSGGIAQLDSLVVHLVGGGQRQDGEDSDKSLKVQILNIKAHVIMQTGILALFTTSSLPLIHEIQCCTKSTGNLIARHFSQNQSCFVLPHTELYPQTCSNIGRSTLQETP